MAEISADTSKFEQGTRKTKTALDQQAQAFAKFSAEATRNAKSFVAYEAQKAKAIAATERAAAKMAKEEERAAKAAAKLAEAQRKASLSIAPGIESGTKRLQEFTQANAGLLSVATLAAGAVLAIGAAAGKTINDLVEYGDQVQRIKTITGQSAEETSRQIQLANDLRVSYDDLAKSLKIASDKGFDTSVDGLARMADEYKKLAPGIERTQFLTDKFGKTGIEMGKILEQDSATLKDMAANVDIGQILTDEDLEKLRVYNRTLDKTQDAFEGLKGQAGKAILPFATGALEAAAGYMRMLDLMTNKHMSLGEAWRQAHDEMNRDREVFKKVGEDAEAAGEGIDPGLVGPLETAEETAKRLSNTYSGLLSSMFAIQKENDNYEKTTTDLAKKDQELADKKQRLTYEWYQLQAAGKGTEEAMLDYMKSVDEVTRAEAENAQARVDLEADREKASKQREYDLAKERLSVNGLTSEEFEGLQTVAVQKGLVSKAAADQAIAESQAADMIIQSMGLTNQTMNETLDAMMAIRAQGGMVQFGVNFSSNVPGTHQNLNWNVPGADYSSSNPQASPGGYGYHPKKRDTGGAGIAGQPYMIGTGAQPEMFVPKTDGQFVPNANKTMGTTYNIYITNPKRETSENSVRDALIKLSYTGVAA